MQYGAESTAAPLLPGQYGYAQAAGLQAAAPRPAVRLPSGGGGGGGACGACTGQHRKHVCGRDREGDGEEGKARGKRGKREAEEAGGEEEGEEEQLAALAQYLA